MVLQPDGIRRMALELRQVAAELSKYRAVTLAETGVISRELRAAFQGAGGFGNVLVHEYVEIDLGEVAAAARQAPDLFPRYAAEVLRWLDAHLAAGDRP